MDMLNCVCAPEMSFNSECKDDVPHAYVTYLDSERESVPLMFFHKFPSDWRTEGWDKTYLYKVFWSPNDETPADMLKRVPKIPMFEGPEKRGPGYYRASVELVKESLAELENFLDSGKRLSIGVLKYKHTSNDLGQSKQQSEAESKSRQQRRVLQASKKNSEKPVVLKHAKKDSKKKKKQSGSCHDLPQVETLRAGLAQRLPHLFEENSDRKVDSPVAEPHEASEGDSSDKDDDLDSTMPTTPQDTLKRSSRLSSTSTHSIKRKVFSATSSSSDDSKKAKLDPDFTPRKFVMATEEIVMLKATIKRISDLNLKLQEKLLKQSDSIDALQSDISELKAKCKCWNMTKSPPMESNDVTPAAAPQKIVTPKMEEREGAELLCEAIIGDHTDTKKECVDSDTEKEEESSAKNWNIKEEIDQDDGGWKEVSPALKEMITKIPPGAKKDVKYIKELSIVLFGPETLGGSSIFGTLKGSKGDDSKVAKPKLDSKKLEAIEAMFIERVGSEEKISPKEVLNHERYSKQRINNAVRDAQKWCRERGYGVGKMENKVNENVFLAKKIKNPDL